MPWLRIDPFQDGERLSMTDDILAFMRKNPKREYTARTIAEELFEPSPYKVRQYTANVYTRLRTLEKYALVRSRKTPGYSSVLWMVTG